MARFGVKEVANVTFYDLLTNEPVLFLDTLKMTNLENSAETVYATGGQGNSRLVGWDYGRTATFTIQDALLNPKALSMQLGTETKEQKETIHAREHVIAKYDGSANFTVEVTELIKADSGVAGVVIPNVYLTDTTGKEHKSKIAMATATFGTSTIGTKTVSEITIPATAMETAGYTGTDDVPVLVYFVFETVDNAEVVTVSSDKYSGFYKVVGDTLWRNEQTGADELVQFVAPKVKITSAFTMTMQADGEPSVFDFNLDVFKDSGSTDMVKFIKYAK